MKRIPLFQLLHPQGLDEVNWSMKNIRQALVVIALRIVMTIGHPKPLLIASRLQNIPLPADIPMNLGLIWPTPVPVLRDARKHLRFHDPPNILRDHRSVHQVVIETFTVVEVARQVVTESSCHANVTIEITVHPFRHYRRHHVVTDHDLRLIIPIRLLRQAMLEWTRIVTEEVDTVDHRVTVENRNAIAMKVPSSIWIRFTEVKHVFAPRPTPIHRPHRLIQRPVNCCKANHSRPILSVLN